MLQSVKYKTKESSKPRRFSLHSIQFRFKRYSGDGVGVHMDSVGAHMDSIMEHRDRAGHGDGIGDHVDSVREYGNGAGAHGDSCDI